MPKRVQEFTFEPFLELLKEVRERVRQARTRAWTDVDVKHSKNFFCAAEFCGRMLRLVFSQNLACKRVRRSHKFPRSIPGLATCYDFAALDFQALQALQSRSAHVWAGSERKKLEALP